MKPRPKTALETGVLLALAFIGMGILLLATRQGAGLSPDSASYLAMARNLLSEGRLRDLGTWQGFAPAVVFPPLFPAVLSLLGLLGLDPVTAARVLNAIFFGANIFLIGWILLRLTSSLAVAAIGAFFSLTSLCLLLIHSMAWTEPLFLFLMLTALYLLSSYLTAESPHYGFLLLASLLAALGVLTRKAGLGLVLTGFSGLLLLGRRKNFFKRLLEAATFLSFSVILLGGWSVWKNHAGHGIYEVKALAFHPFLHDFFRQTAFTVSVWLVPESVPVFVRAGILFIFLAGFFAAGFLASSKDKTPFPVLILLFAFFIVCHFAVYAGSITFFANQFVDNRALSPVFAAGVILVFFVLHRLAQSRPFSTALKASLILLGAVLGISYAARAASWVAETASQGQGYASLAWKSSPTMEAVRALPEGIPLYTNAPDAVYLLTGKLSSGLPAKYVSRKIHVAGLKENSAYSSEWNKMMREIKDGRGVLAYFDELRARPYYPTKTDLEKDLAPAQGESTRDGILYRF